MPISKKISEEAISIYGKFLSLNSMFFTKERKLILAMALNHSSHFSADELLFDIQKAHKKVSRATIYRCLRQMVECGVLVEADFGHGHQHYELSLGNERHIHLIDTKTGKVREVVNEDLYKIISKIANSESFEISHQKIQLFGINKT